MRAIAQPLPLGVGEIVAVVGSRDYPDLDAVRRSVRSLPSGTVVLSGGAKGVDKTAEDEARACGLAVKVYPADWRRYGRRAGAVRNTLIVERSTRVVAFWDGLSRGTKITIDLTVAAGKPLEIVSP